MEDIVLPEVPENLKPENNPEPQEPQAPVEPVEPVVAEEAATEPVEEQPEIKKGEANRIKELNQRAKTAEAKAKSLAERLAEITSPAPALPVAPTMPTYEEGEITQERYSADVSKAADAKIELRIAQERAINRIDKESLEAVSKYPQLNPNSEQFDPELNDTVTEAVEASVRLNPYSASPVKLVDKLMKHYQSAVTKEATVAAGEIVKQAGESALRPTAVRQPEKPAVEKSIAELEAELGTVIA